MAIQSGDVKLLKSAVMADVPEGGGPPTGNVIQDGVSNSIFPDISELDRAGGRVNLRKTHVSIQTDDTDTYFGGNIIVAEPPQDPRVSVTLFSNENTFDTRVQAQSRVESYLNKGSEWGGFLYENHIAGQRAIQLFQRVDSEIPRVGQTLVLVQNESLATEKMQYVRVTKVSKIERTFTYDTDKDYKAWIITLDISDALRTDFTGTSANRQFTRSPSATLTRETLVADAGSYYGVSALSQVAHIGDFSIEADSIYTQLVPSAQTETPLADVGLTQSTTGYSPTGNVTTMALTQGFTTSQAMYIGGGILPGSLSLVRDTITLTDKAGRLYNGTTEVGQIDYENGILTLSTSVFGTGPGLHTISYRPAVGSRLVGGSIGEYVTAENRSLSKVFTLPEIPAPYSLIISYPVGGRWYVLREDGTGAIRGTDSSYGAGTLNRTTGTVTVTFGALPDVGGAIIYQWLPSTAAVAVSNVTSLSPFNFSLPKIRPTLSSIVITWTEGTSPRTATVDSSGVISGHATGQVYGNLVSIKTNSIVPKGTVFHVAYDYTDVSSSNYVLTATNYALSDHSPTQWKLDFANPFLPAYENIEYGVIRAEFYRPAYMRNNVPYGREAFPAALKLERDGKVYAEFNLGTSALGAVYNRLVGTFSGTTIYIDRTIPVAMTLASYTTAPVDSGSDLNRTVVSISNGNTDVVVDVTTGRMGNDWRVFGGGFYFDVVTGSGSTTHDSDPVNALTIQTPVVPNSKLSGVKFTLNGENYAQSYFDDSLMKNISPTTGTGPTVGTVVGAQGLVQITDWTVTNGAVIPPTVTNWTAAYVPVNRAYAATMVVFRTATAPLRPTSLTISGEMLDGTTFSVTANAQGKFIHSRVKGRVNYDSGVVEIYFVEPTTDPIPPADLIDLTFLGISGLTTAKVGFGRSDNLVYNAVAYTYLPLDADILGIDPVRLPSDGRVPIFRPGGFAVVGHTGSITATVSNGQTIDCARVRLSRVRVIGANGAVINNGYTTNLESGTVTFTNVSGYSQPVTIQHRIEDMAIVSDAQIGGLITFTRPLTHEYPLGSYVSSALIAGDLFARVSTVFDQSSWNNTWADAVQGSPATATFNTTQYPIEVTNRGAITERWIIRFTNTTAFEVIGENVGVIAVGNTSADCAPVNPATGAPYFTIRALGWGSGWSTGNVLRLNTIGAGYPVWVVRTIQQGPETVPDDTFTLLIRGDVNTP